MKKIIKLILLNRWKIIILILYSKIKVTKRGTIKPHDKQCNVHLSNGIMAKSTKHTTKQ